MLYFYAVEPILRGHENAIDRIITNYQKKASYLFWAAASQIGVRWSGFLVQVIRLYLETALQSNPDFNNLSIEGTEGEEMRQEAMDTTMDTSASRDHGVRPVSPLSSRPLDINTYKSAPPFMDEDVYSDNDEPDQADAKQGYLSVPIVQEIPVTPTSTRRLKVKKRTTRNSSRNNM